MNTLRFYLALPLAYIVVGLAWLVTFVAGNDEEG